MPYVPTEQQAAILGHDYHRHARILAGPGTGKSATLVALVDRLLQGNPRPRIKLLTFTRAATAELAKKVSEHPAAAAERPSTIHSFSISVLLRNPGTGDFPEPLRIADKWEDKKIVLPTLARRAGVTVKNLDRLIPEMAANWESLQPAVDVRVDPADRARFLGAWGEHRQVYGYTLLAELPYWLRHALHDHPDLDGVDYDLLIVDEYQDLNACDLEVLHLIAERGCAIIGAGDDDQSIYSLRRAAPEGIRRFPDDYPGCANYPLSITQRCGARIIEWASYVIDGDLGRPAGRPRLAAADGSPPGDVALLAFERETSEAQGVAALIQRLNQRGVPPEEILVLMRSDHNGAFSRPIKEALDALGIRYSDPDVVEHMLAEPANRRMLATFRLLFHRRDSLAWATLFLLRQALEQRFAVTSMPEHATGVFNSARPSLMGSMRIFLGRHVPPASDGVDAAVIAWLDAHPLPDETPENGWGHWIVAAAGGDTVPAPSADCATLLHALDDLMEEPQLRSIPLADRAARERSGACGKPGCPHHDDGRR